jgi:hypothetical protein
MRIWVAIAVAAAACGGTATREQAYDVHSHDVGEKHDVEEEHHGVGVAEIDSFHDTLAPIWHEAAGDARTKHACAAVATMREQATAIVGRARADHAQWEGNGNALVKAVAKLADACGGKTFSQPFDEAFGGVHDAYHALMEAAMAGTGEEHAHIGH